MLLAFLALMAGLILDTVTRGRWSKSAWLSVHTRTAGSDAAMSAA